LEIRSPFLDYKLVEYVYNLPETFKTDKKNGKIILKDILLEIMPREFVHRRKQGFGAPVKEWLKTDTMKIFVYKHLSNEAKIFDYLKKESVKEMLGAFYDKKDESVYYKIWTLLCLELWFNTHKQYHCVTNGTRI
jgi:asparagine synthase (glutamine-hydrolysing)